MDKITKKIDEAQEEISHNRSGALRSILLGTLAGVISTVGILFVQKKLETHFPSDDSANISKTLKSAEEIKAGQGSIAQKLSEAGILAADAQKDKQNQFEILSKEIVGLKEKMEAESKGREAALQQEKQRLLEENNALRDALTKQKQKGKKPEKARKNKKFSTGSEKLFNQFQKSKSIAALSFGPILSSDGKCRACAKGRANSFVV